MRVQLAAGAELDLLSPAELQDALKPLLDALGQLRPPDILVRTAVLNIDGAGLIGGGPRGAGVRIYAPRLGFRADILRISTWSPANDPQNPLVAGYLAFSRDTTAAAPEVYFPGTLGNTVAPASYESDSSCPRLRQGESLLAYGTGLPANSEILVNLTVRLWGEVSRLNFEPAE